jgi:hypothetical protein
MHSDGGAWRLVTSPSPLLSGDENNALLDVIARAPGDVWAVVRSQCWICESVRGILSTSPGRQLPRFATLYSSILTASYTISGQSLRCGRRLTRFTTARPVRRCS